MYTSIEQSNTLIGLGLDPKSADMYYFLDPTPAGNIYVPSLMIAEKHLKSRMPEYDKGDIPCWSTDSLIRLLPEKIFGPEPKDHPTELMMGKVHGKYSVMYFDWTGMQHGPEFTGEILLDALYNMVVWVLENNISDNGSKLHNN